MLKGNSIQRLQTYTSNTLQEWNFLGYYHILITNLHKNGKNIVKLICLTKVTQKWKKYSQVNLSDKGYYRNSMTRETFLKH